MQVTAGGIWRDAVDIYSYCLVAESCPTLCDPMDCSPLGSSDQGIFQATVLEWIAISFSRGSSWIGRQILYHWAIWEDLTTIAGNQMEVGFGGVLEKQVYIKCRLWVGLNIDLVS